MGYPSDTVAAVDRLVQEGNEIPRTGAMFQRQVAGKIVSHVVRIATRHRRTYRTHLQQLFPQYMFIEDLLDRFKAYDSLSRLMSSIL